MDTEYNQDLTTTEFYGEYFGAITSPIDVRDYQLSRISEDLPSVYQLDTTPVKNQKDKPTCVPHTLASIIEYHNVVEGNPYIPFSTEFIYGCRFDLDTVYNCEGLRIRDALHIVKNYGDVPFALLPGNHLSKAACEVVNENFDKLKDDAYKNRITAYYKVNSVEELKHAIYMDGPVICNMKWYTNSSTTKSGILKYNKNTEYQAHAVMIIGWDTESWILQNSWGLQWGNRGKFRVLFEDSFDQLFTEVYGITDDIQSVNQRSSWICLLSPIINLLLNIFKSFNKQH